MKKIRTITSLGVLLSLIAVLFGPNIPSVYAAVRATDGPNCYRVTVNNAGVLSTSLVICP